MCPWFKSIISLFILTSAFPSLSNHLDRFFQAAVVISLLFLYNTLKKQQQMGRFNKKDEGVKPTIVNHMGEKAYKPNAEEELVSTVMTTMLSDSYYEKEKDKVERIKSLMDQVDPYFVAQTALYVRKEGKLRSVTHLMASVLASKASGKEWASRFYNKIVMRPDDMSEILGCCAALNDKNPKKLRGISSAIKKGFKTALEGLDPYRIDKYKMDSRVITMVDLVNLFHPKGNQANKTAFQYLIEGRSLSGLYESKILEKEMSKAGQDKKDNKEKKEALGDAIRDVVSNVKGMPIFNMVRNLVNIIKYAPDQIDEVCRQLTIEEKVLNSKMPPFRFASAFKEVENIGTDDSENDIVFESDKKRAKLTARNKDKILDALEKAITISCKNLPVLEGRSAILIDHSGSVRGDMGGSSEVSAFSKTNTAVIGNLFGCMIASVLPDVFIGMFGDKLINYEYDRSKGVLWNNKKSFTAGGECGGATENGLFAFLDKCVKDKIKVDNLYVISDMQIGDGESVVWEKSSNYGYGKFAELLKGFKKVNPNCKIVSISIQGYGSEMFYRGSNILNIAGWSESIFDVINSKFCGYKNMIEEIKKIKI